MTHLIDSDRIASFLKGIPAAVELVRPLLFGRPAISIISYGEIYEGILTGREPARQEASFSEFLTPCRILGVDERVALRYAEVRGLLRRQGNLIPDNDLFIASTALVHGLTLVTGNRRHFDRVPGLRILWALAFQPSCGSWFTQSCPAS